MPKKKDLAILEAISKTEKWVEVKDGVGSYPQEYVAIFRGLRFKPDVEIGPFGVFEMAS
jgi:hypothetical protein